MGAVGEQFVSVMYPNEGSEFDMGYYLGTHGSLVRGKWDSLGLKSLKVIKGLATSDPDTLPPCQLIALLEFGSVEESQAAVADSGDEVLGDIPNFTDIQPVIQVNTKIE